LATILRETKVRRIRLSSLGPQYLSGQFFEVLRDNRVCDHLHLSVQSGSPSVLRRMCRGHGVGEVEQAAREARRVRPDVAITGDFIVGFPGETEAEFQQTLSLVERAGFAQLHVFPFSPREGTEAMGMSDHISTEEKKARVARLMAVGQTLWHRFLGTQQGRCGSAIVLRDGTAITSNNIRLRGVKGRPGSVVDVVVDVDAVVG